ncbi:MAG: prepilin peptidase [Nitrospina sp.]|jgi:leader peptidase (prepilin peptidase) / N-methyltransferase|nr:prepilin peptidase [Nitrospina sp.]MBT3414475.1 prepilin peptidase [Nitrospina sp.]MBT3856996.1 prepilin peptidase [Nitrospina sp.]MBT4105843.1 prepilin peptidase [Nitrospina sp.]MBT4388086.1 prepilin peptidase [Nitrospina sp.]
MEFIQAIPYPLLTVAVFCFGLTVGSFANVCIHRLPRKESVVFPGSHCPACSAAVRPLDNIPVISYIILGGKCRDCSIRISPIYPAIEAVTAVLLLAGFFKFGLSFDFLVYVVVAPALVIITAIDIEHQIIPDIITLPGIVLGLAVGTYTIGYANSLLGFFAGGGLFYLLAVLSNGGMGGGDIKYIAAAGALLGWQKVLLVIFIGAFLGSIVGLFQIAVQKKSRKSLIPFGPFLATGTLVTLFYGNPLIRLYLDYLGR